jgi:hypothetical protein
LLSTISSGTSRTHIENSLPNIRLRTASNVFY